MTKLLDSNIPIYAQGKKHPLQSACVTILETAVRNPGVYVLDTEVLQEVAHVYNRRGERERAIKVIPEVMTYFRHVLPMTERDIALMCDLLRRVSRLSPRDAIHAAVVINNDLDGIVSADTDFDAIPSFARFDPEAEASLWSDEKG